MRLDVYLQELPQEVVHMSTVTDIGTEYHMFRLYLANPDISYPSPSDDDRSAITFWIPNVRSFDRRDLADMFYQMYKLCEKLPDREGPDNGNTGQRDE